MYGLRIDDLAMMKSIEIKLFVKNDQEMVHERLQRYTYSESLTYLCIRWNGTQVVKSKCYCDCQVQRIDKR